MKRKEEEPHPTPKPVTNGLFVAGTLVAAQTAIALLEAAFLHEDCAGQNHATRSDALEHSALMDGAMDAVLLGPALSLLYALKHAASTPFTL